MQARMGTHSSDFNGQRSSHEIKATLISPPLPSFLLDCPWGFVGDVCDSGGTAYQNGQVGFFAECLLVNIQVTSEHRRSAARLAAKYDSANYPIIGLDI